MTNEEKIMELSKKLVKVCKEKNDNMFNETISEIIGVYFRILERIPINDLTEPMLIVVMRNYIKMLELSATKNNLEFADEIMNGLDTVAIIKPL